MKYILKFKWSVLGVVVGIISINLVMLGGSNKKGVIVNDKIETAYFAGGCFWCMEEAFEKVEGVVAVESGYMGGEVESPTYEQVSYGNTGHTEAIKVEYDPKKTTYSSLLKVFWINVDATDAEGQFCDRGSQYRAAIFYRNEEEKQAVAESKKRWKDKLNKAGEIVTEVSLAKTFYPAEEYHQDYSTKNPLRYKYYKYSCGREKKLKAVWGKYYQKK